MGIASMVLGIISLVCCIIPFLWGVAIVTTIIGFFLGLFGTIFRRRCAIAGLVMSIIAGVLYFALGYGISLL